MSDAASRSSAEDVEETRSEPLIEAAEHDAESPSQSPTANEGDGSSSRQSLRMPAQKRRRVTRACDECRRKKIKCDGKQPCTHCTVYSYDCTYDQPSHRRRNPGPQYIEALELRLQRAESALRMLAPDLDLNDPNLESNIRKVYQPDLHQHAAQASHQSGDEPVPADQPDASDANLESMLTATGQLDLDSRGYWDYHGHSSGLSFIRGVREHVGDLNGPEQAENSTPYVRSVLKDDPKDISDSSGIRVEVQSEMGSYGTEELPPRDMAKQICAYALDDATTILSCVHQPSFYEAFDRIYNRHPATYENEDHKFLPLLYSVLALGCVFAKDEKSNLEVKGYKSATHEGYRYFWSSRQLLDIADCRDLVSLQSIVFMILFLQCSAKLPTCYAYIGVALRSAIRMGLHRSFDDSFSPIESETRKRVFWVIRKMDIHVGAMLGLPQTLSDDDIDQDYPTEVDDECITEEGIQKMPPGKTAITAASNANFRLNKVISKIVRQIYPIKGFPNRDVNPSRTYSISYNTIKDIEGDLQQWLETLPEAFQTGVGGSPKVQRAQQLLRMAYAHAQLMLYRPFLHYVSGRSPSQPLDHRSYACAAACVGVSRNIVQITAEMNRRGLLTGSYWFVMYTTFFGILSLVFFAIENPESASSEDVMRDAEEGKKTLAALAKRSMAADRCTSTLTTLFKHYYGIVEERSDPQAVRPVPSQSQPATEQVNSRASLPLADRSTSTSKSGSQASSSTRRSKKPSAKRATRPSLPIPQQTPTTSNYFSPASPLAIESPTSAGGYSQQYARQEQHYQPQAQTGSQQSPVQIRPRQPYEGYHHEEKLTDLSSIMFPSQDPFEYPNHMMTMLEQTRPREGGPNLFSTGEYSDGFGVTSSAGPSAPMSGGDQIDVQLFGPLPPYMHMPHPQFPMFDSTPTGHQMNNQQMGQRGRAPEVDTWSQQQRSAGLPGMDLNEIFGGDEWRGYSAQHGQDASQQ